LIVISFWYVKESTLLIKFKLAYRNSKTAIRNNLKFKLIYEVKLEDDENFIIFVIINIESK